MGNNNITAHKGSRISRKAMFKDRNYAGTGYAMMPSKRTLRCARRTAGLCLEQAAEVEAVLHTRRGNINLSNTFSLNNLISHNHTINRKDTTSHRGMHHNHSKGDKNE
jgi:hypothetical protein